MAFLAPQLRKYIQEPHRDDARKKGNSGLTLFCSDNTSVNIFSAGSGGWTTGLSDPPDGSLPESFTGPAGILILNDPLKLCLRIRQRLLPHPALKCPADFIQAIFKGASASSDFITALGINRNNLRRLCVP